MLYALCYASHYYAVHSPRACLGELCWHRDLRSFTYCTSSTRKAQTDRIRWCACLRCRGVHSAAVIEALARELKEERFLQPGADTKGKRHSFLSFSLCLSRACLGKMIVYIYKWRKKGDSIQKISFYMTNVLLQGSLCLCAEALFWYSSKLELQRICIYPDTS